VLHGLSPVTEQELLQWIRGSIATGTNVFGRGYQGHAYLYQRRDRRLVIKTATGWGPMRLIRRAMLRNEHRVYSRLAGLAGVPRCYGLLQGRYLILEYIEGTPLREAHILDREDFFGQLLELIRSLHGAGIAHGDLKKKDNILVIDGRVPCIVDFGVAVVRKEGVAPLNAYLYNLAKRFDLNALVRHKLGRRTRQLMAEPNDLYKFTSVEKVSRWLKRVYSRSKKTIKRYLTLQRL
jgi:predicted Ser/Thr protein kinase